MSEFLTITAFIEHIMENNKQTSTRTDSTNWRIWNIYTGSLHKIFWQVQCICWSNCYWEMYTKFQRCKEDHCILVKCSIVGLDVGKFTGIQVSFVIDATKFSFGQVNLLYSRHYRLFDLIIEYIIIEEYLIKVQMKLILAFG